MKDEEDSTVAGALKAMAIITANFNPYAKTPMQSISFEVAGIRHHMTEFLRAAVQHGDAVVLEPEPDNTFDPNAIKVLKKGIHVGYVPRTQTEALLEGVKAKRFDYVVSAAWPKGCCVTVTEKPKPKEDDSRRPTDKEAPASPAKS